MIKYSILVPSFKARFLSQCINSVLEQTYPNWELIIVNDASPEDLDSVVKACSDERIIYHVNACNCGSLNVVDNWNICLSYATGDYVICMGDDDVLKPCCLEEYTKLAQKYPGIGLMHGWTEVIDENSVPFMLQTHRCEHESAMSLLWHKIYAYHLQYIGDFCFKRDYLNKCGGFYKLPYAWGSDELSAFIAAGLNGVANTQRVVFQYRSSSQTITSSGHIEEKIQAINDEYAWIFKYIGKACENHEDELYRKQLVAELPHMLNKKLGSAVADDCMNKSLLRLFFWFVNRRKYKLNMAILAYALILTVKQKSAHNAV